MIWLALIPIAAAVLFCWWPRRPAPSSPFPPVTDTVAGHAQRTLGERLSGSRSCCDGCHHYDHSPCLACGQSDAECMATTWPEAARLYDWTTDDGPDAA